MTSHQILNNFMSLSFTIRKHHASDLPQIYSLIKELSIFEKVPHRLINSLERMIAEQNHFHAFVAVNNQNEILAYATYNLIYYTWVGKSIYMDDLYVKSEYRGQGIGRDLIESVLTFAKENGCHKVRWQVSEWNERAIEFYKSLGAEIDAVEKNCEVIIL